MITILSQNLISDLTNKGIPKLGFFYRLVSLPKPDSDHPRREDYRSNYSMIANSSSRYNYLYNGFSGIPGLFSQVGCSNLIFSRIYPAMTLVKDDSIILSLYAEDTETESARYSIRTNYDAYDEDSTSIKFIALYCFNLIKTSLYEIYRVVNCELNDHVLMSRSYLAGLIVSVDDTKDGNVFEFLPNCYNQISMRFSSDVIGLDTQVFDRNLYSRDSMAYFTKFYEEMSASHFQRSYISSKSFLNCNETELINHTSVNELGALIGKNAQKGKRLGVSMDCTGCFTA